MRARKTKSVAGVQESRSRNIYEFRASGSHRFRLRLAGSAGPEVWFPTPYNRAGCGRLYGSVAPSSIAACQSKRRSFASKNIATEIGPPAKWPHRAARRGGPVQEGENMSS